MSSFYIVKYLGNDFFRQFDYLNSSKIDELTI